MVDRYDHRLKAHYLVIVRQLEDVPPREHLQKFNFKSEILNFVFVFFFKLHTCRDS